MIYLKNCLLSITTKQLEAFLCSWTTLRWRCLVSYTYSSTSFSNQLPVSVYSSCIFNSRDILINWSNLDVWGRNWERGLPEHALLQSVNMHLLFHLPCSLHLCSVCFIGLIACICILFNVLSVVN